MSKIGIKCIPYFDSQVPGPALLFNRTAITGSIIGGLPNTQEVIDFCHKHNIRPAIELIKGDRLLEVYEKLSGKNDSITRYVLDIDASI